MPEHRIAGVKPPNPLLVGASARHDWRRFKEDWDDYAIIQDVGEKPDAMQMSLFRIALGADGKKLLRNQPVPKKPDGTLMDANKLDTLLQMMETAVMGEVNDTYERYVFRTRVQRSGESIDEFVLDLRELIKTCAITEDMVDKFLKDQIIYGVTDDTVREKLLQERNLTLSKCLDMCRAAESASAQAREMTAGGSANSQVNKVNHWKKKEGRRQKQGGRGDRQTPEKRGEKKECRFCGLRHVMKSGVCPALGKTCDKCGGLNHYARKCGRKQVNGIDAESSDDDAEPTTSAGEVRVVRSSHQICALSSGPRAKLRVQGKSKVFLLDTGASANLISSHDIDCTRIKLTTPGRSFSMWNGSKQQAIGQARIAVYNPVTRHTHDVNFDVVPAKLAPILGCEVVQNMGLVQLNTSQYDSIGNVQPKLKTKEDYTAEFRETFKKEIGTLEGQVSFQLDPTITPTTLPARQIPVALREPVKREIERLRRLDVIVPVTSPTDWVSQMVTVHKKDGSVRLCIDPRPLNEALKRAHYHLPTFAEVVPHLGDAKIFSKVDLRAGYWHVQLDQKTSELTAFQTPYGRYRWKRLPFGLNVSSEIFQRKVHEALDGLTGIFCVADDIVIAGVGSTMDEARKSHDERLHALLTRCEETGIALNEDKFVLCQESLEFMGHVVGADGIRPDPAKVKAITAMPAPTDVSSVRRFLGMVNFLAKFVPHLTNVVKPIQALTCKDVVWYWGSEHEQAFTRVKRLLCEAPVLAHFDVNKPLIVQCDASKDGLGSVLLQNGHPLAYASRSLTTAERNYAQIEKEMLSVVFSLEHFHQFTYGRPVTVHNDHKPLVMIQKKAISKAPIRLQRMLMRLQAYQYDIVHVPGKDMHIADALSRAYLPVTGGGDVFDAVNAVIVSDLTASELAELQRSIHADEQMSALLKVVKEGWPANKVNCPALLTPYWDFRDELTVSDDIVIKGQSLLIPRELRPKYIRLAHNAHQGPDSCIRRARESMFWPGMNTDIRVAIEKCETCARYAPQQQKEPLLQPKTASRAWSTVCADIFSFEGTSYLVTVDSLSGFFEIDHLRSLTSTETIQKLKAIFARYGTPNKFVSDNGPQFASSQFQEFAEQWRFHHRTSSPHYPRSNGQAEAAVKVAKTLLQKAKRDNRDIYMALLDHRNTPRATTGLSPVQVLMQRKTRTATLPQALQPSANECQARHTKEKRQQQVKLHHDKTAATLPPIPIGANVWYANWRGLQQTWSRGKVTSVNGRSYFITNRDGAQYRRNRSQVKPDTTSDRDDDYDDDEIEDQPIQPPDTTRRAEGYGFVPPAQTRSGRNIKPVQRL